MAEIYIKDAPLVSLVGGTDKLPVSQGTSTANSVSVNQLVAYAGGVFVPKSTTSGSNTTSITNSGSYVSLDINTGIGGGTIALFPTYTSIESGIGGGPSSGVTAYNNGDINLNYSGSLNLNSTALTSTATELNQLHGVTILTTSNISNTAYDATSWDGVNTIAPSKNAVRDKIEAMSILIDTATSTAYRLVVTNGVLGIEEA